MTTARVNQEETQHQLRHHLIWVFALGVMISVWLWLYAPTLRYLQNVFSIEDFRTNQVLLIGIVGLIMYRTAERWQTGQAISVHLSTNWRPFTLVVLCTLAWLAAERRLGLNTVSATLFGLGSYGLIGLFMRPDRWRRGFPAAFLIIGTLPFNAHTETFLGYPLRIFTAQLVGDGLAAAGYASIGVDTILIFENGISKVDLPCSGVQSLWAGTLFFLAATWLEEKKIGFRWLLSIGVFGLVLIGANTLRVAILVTVGEALGFHFAAELLHIPLGILGFVAACAVAMVMLRYFVPRNNQSAESVTIDKPSSSIITNPLNRALLLILLF
ncbi:MAG: archaeosortase/exosortase family protein, partial [Chloroflexota bacterium]